MNRAEKLSYQRGYNAGSKGAWPAHRPPQPPNRIVVDLIDSAQRLRDEVDDFLATALDEEDPVAISLGAAIDRVDRSLECVTEWLHE